MDEHREVTLTPDRYLTYRYAGASGDFNPIHLDDEFARSVGLPGRILHGLWTMAQVARVHGERFGAIRPANTLVQAQLVGEEYLVEIEAEALIGAGDAL